MLLWRMNGVRFGVSLWYASIDIRRVSVVSVFACDVFVDEVFLGS